MLNVLALQGSKTRHTNLIRSKRREGDVAPHFQFLAILFSMGDFFSERGDSLPQNRTYESYIVKENHIG